MNGRNYVSANNALLLGELGLGAPGNAEPQLGTHLFTTAPDRNRFAQNYFAHLFSSTDGRIMDSRIILPSHFADEALKQNDLMQNPDSKLPRLSRRRNEGGRLHFAQNYFAYPPQQFASIRVYSRF